MRVMPMTRSKPGLDMLSQEDIQDVNRLIGDIEQAFLDSGWNAEELTASLNYFLRVFDDYREAPYGEEAACD